MEFKRLKANLKKDFAGKRKVKAAVLGDSATQLLCQALRGAGYEAGLDISIHEADYDQVDLQVHTPGSELYESDPDYVILFHSAQKLHKAFRKSEPARRAGFADAYLEKAQGLWNALGRERSRRIVHFNVAEIDDGVFGHFANKVDQSFLYQLRRINVGLMDLSRRFQNVFINDVAALHARAGLQAAFSPQLYVNAEMVFALDFLPEVAKGVVDIIAASLGSVRKCLVLDLDNTVWGGIIGDDGMENIQIGDLGVGKAFTEVQWWAKQLKERGIILAVCSKNTEKIAKEPFEKHPEMVLGLDDVAVFVANWENKPDNIRHIQSILNIGLDSMVFIDDNPFEREMVRKALPEVTVPELPVDPAEYAPFLRSLNLFETVSFTEEDGDRTRMYREEAGRKALETSYASEEEFLAGLEMYAEVSAFNKFNIPRVAQLTQRSNQFNLRTVRYTDEEIENLAKSPDARTFAINLEDRFGDYGLISAIILKRDGDAFFVDTWIMSCRVLKRGVEQLALDGLVQAARKAGAARLVGEYLPTPKNGLVKDHFSRLGFKESGGRWELRLADYRRTDIFIKEKNA